VHTVRCRNLTGRRLPVVTDASCGVAGARRMLAVVAGNHFGGCPPGSDRIVPMSRIRLPMS
jgi:hypothetical protein